MATDFTVIPNELFDALASGDLTPSMFIAMQFLHRWADWQTGVVRKVRAGRMEDAANGAYSASTFQEALRNLKRAGRISSDHRGGSRSWYCITLCNYTVLSGSLKGQVLNASETRDWRVFRKSRRGENQPEAGVRPGCDRGEAQGEAMRVLKSSQEFSQESRQKSSQESSLEESEASLASQAAQDIPNLNSDQSVGQNSEVPILIDPGVCNPVSESAPRQEYESVSSRSGGKKNIISIPSRPASATEFLAGILCELLDQPARYDVGIWAADLESLARRHNTDFIGSVWEWAYKTGPHATVQFWQGRTFNARNARSNFETQAEQMEKARAAAKKRASRANHTGPAIPEGIKL
jgi:hypothetical protein